MTYASGGLIQASDFNNLNGASAGTQGGGGQINPVWATGFGSYGYGQTAIGNVSVSSTVAASDWASMINKLNSARTHQSGSGSGISAPSAGATITYLSTLSSAITTAATNRLSMSPAASGSLAGSKTISISAAAGVAGSGSVTFTVTAPNVDQMRYFWNCGGYIIVTAGTFTNTGGTSRGTSIGTLFGTNFASKRINNASYGARTGTGGTVVTDTTAGGYWAASTSIERLRINSTSYYSGDYMNMSDQVSGSAGSYGGLGPFYLVTVGGYSATTGSTQPPDSINISQVITLTVYYPETTNLSNSWGTFTIT